MTDVALIVELPPLPGITYDEFDADAECNDSLDLGGAGDKAPLNSKQMEFSLKQFTKWMGQANFRTFNEWKKVWVAGVLKKKHAAIIPVQNLVRQLQDGPVH